MTLRILLVGCLIAACVRILPLHAQSTDCERAPPAIPAAAEAICLFQKAAAHSSASLPAGHQDAIADIVDRIEKIAWPLPAADYVQRAAAALSQRSDPDDLLERFADALISGAGGTLYPKAFIGAPRTFGLGVQRDRYDGAVRVIRLTPGGPAERAGIPLNASVLRFGVAPAADVRLEHLDFLPSPLAITYSVRGREHTVTLEAAGGGSTSPSRDHILIGGTEDVAVIKINLLAAGTARSLTERLPFRAKGYVLDLRHCPGGLLDQVVEVADIFLERGRILTTDGRPSVLEASATFNAKSGDIARQKPLIVLINRFTTSGAAILAAALADNQRATLIGETTGGHGRVETVIPLKNGRFMALPTSLLVRASGAVFDGVGVEPDIAVPDTRISDDPQAPDAIMDRAVAEIREKLPQ